MNDVARAAKYGNETQVRRLANEVFRSAALEEEIPAGIDEAIKDRIVRAELKYKRGERDSIPELNIVCG